MTTLPFHAIATQHLEIGCELGLKPDEFWDMIPSEFGILVEHRYKAITEEENRHQRRTALLAAMIANYSGMTKKRYKVEDFMPRKKNIGTQAMLEEVKRINAMFGGEIKRR